MFGIFLFERFYCSNFRTFTIPVQSLLAQVADYVPSKVFWMVRFPSNHTVKLCRSTICKNHLHVPRLWYTGQQKKHIFLLFRFTSFKIIIFNVLLSKQICLCMAVGFPAFSCQNSISQQIYVDFCQKGKNHKIVDKCVKNPIFSVILLHMSSAWYNKLQNNIKY